MLLKRKALEGVVRAGLILTLGFMSSMVLPSSSHFHERGCFYTKPGGLQNGEQLVTLAEFSK